MKRAAAGMEQGFCGYPTVCSICGQPARITTDPDGLTFLTVVGQPPVTLHNSCRKVAK